MKLKFLPLLVLPLAACSAIDEQTLSSMKEKAEDVTVPVIVYKDAQKKQCFDGGVSVAKMQGELESAGIEVMCASQENDGKMYAQACGMDEGTINVFKIPVSEFKKASDLGFSLVKDLDVAVKSFKCK